MKATLPIQFLNGLKQGRQQRGFYFGALLIVALLAFEVFNYSTTEFALNDVLGNLSFMGIRWATILSIAFCTIDFAGIARLFTPEQGADEPAEVWYLFGAWVLAAAMNATLTWWGISVAIHNHSIQGEAIIARETLVSVVPVFVAVMVWVIRLLIIGTFAMAGERLFSQASDKLPRAAAPRNETVTYTQPAAAARKPASRPQPSYPTNRNIRPEATYHPVGLAAKDAEESRPWR